MDRQRFDAITRKLARTSSRRSALAVLGGGVVAAVAVPGAAAKRRPHWRRRWMGQVCTREHRCRYGAECIDGRCACPPEQEQCGADCCPPGLVCCNVLTRHCVQPGDFCGD